MHALQRGLLIWAFGWMGLLAPRSSAALNHCEDSLHRESSSRRTAQMSQVFDRLAPGADRLLFSPHFLDSIYVVLTRQKDFERRALRSSRFRRQMAREVVDHLLHTVYRLKSRSPREDEKIFTDSDSEGLNGGRGLEELFEPLPPEPKQKDSSIVIGASWEGMDFEMVTPSSVTPSSLRARRHRSPFDPDAAKKVARRLGLSEAVYRDQLEVLQQIKAQPEQLQALVEIVERTLPVYAAPLWRPVGRFHHKWLQGRQRRWLSKASELAVWTAGGLTLAWLYVYGVVQFVPEYGAFDVLPPLTASLGGTLGWRYGGGLVARLVGARRHRVARAKIRQLIEGLQSDHAARRAKAILNDDLLALESRQRQSFDAEALEGLQPALVMEWGRIENYAQELSEPISAVVERSSALSLASAVSEHFQAIQVMAQGVRRPPDKGQEEVWIQNVLHLKTEIEKILAEQRGEFERVRELKTDLHLVVEKQRQFFDHFEQAVAAQTKAGRADRVDENLAASLAFKREHLAQDRRTLQLVGANLQGLVVQMSEVNAQFLTILQGINQQLVRRQKAALGFSPETLEAVATLSRTWTADETTSENWLEN